MEVQSEESRAARGAEIRKRVGERMREWAKAKADAVSQVERHAFDAVRKKALEGKSKPGVMTRIRSTLEAGGKVASGEAKAAKNKVWLKTLGIIASVGAFIDPEPISKVALAATATGLGVTEKVTEIRAVKKAQEQTDPNGRIVERILQTNRPLSVVH